MSAVRDLFNDTYSIIDGQQRLTTSAIFLSVIRDAFAKVAEDAAEVSPDVAQAAKSQADATQKYLIATDDDGKAYPVLARSEPMFYEQIQNPNAIPSGSKWNGSAERIGAARIFFETRVLGELSSGDHDAQLERLKAIRANVLKARVIQVELASEEDGFIVSEGQLVDVMRLVESFHFQFTSLTNGGSTGGTRGRYNRFAVRLEKASTKSEVADAIKDLADKLRASLPARETAIKAFEHLFYAPNLPLTQAQKIRGRKIFISYVLMSFAKWKHLLPPGQSLSSWSIEHIKPQSLAGDDPKDPTYSIGNLTLLTEALNSELGNADLQTKMKSLKKGSAHFDADLESWSSSGVLVPSDDQLAHRASALAAEALDSVWSL